MTTTELEMLREKLNKMPAGLMGNLNFVRHTDSKGETDDYLILAEYPEVDYTLLIREAKYTPFVAAWGYNKEGNYWSQGHYFSDILDATAWIQSKIDMKSDKITYERISEIATNALHELEEWAGVDGFDDFKRDNDMEESELEYFGFTESEDNEDE